jgi:hypothetical protein
VHSIFADWERGDFSRGERAHPEIEFVFARGPAPGHWKGLTAMTEAWRAFLSAWDTWRKIVRLDGCEEPDAALAAVGVSD